MADAAVPVIDLSAGSDAEIAVRIDQACRDTGFFCITGHGVPDRRIAGIRTLAEEFFALPEEEKLRVQRPPQKISRGYYPFADRSLSYSLGIEAPPDLHESFAFGREVAAGRYHGGSADDAMEAPNLWPDRPAAFRPAMQDWYDTMTALGNRILGIMTLVLGVPEGFFVDKFDHQSSAIRLIRYPAQLTAPEDGQLRAGMHTDYGAITLVRGDDVPGGLQVKLRHGGWMDVHTPPGAFACNIADAMMRWTNDRWVSTLHRVGNPPPEAARRDRISLVFFHMPNHDAVIRCMPGCAAADGTENHPPITYSEHYLGKVMKASHRRTDAGVADATAES